ncbi:hypothetical protein KIS4809_0102 [Bacillus sp. ZZV12-4809]|nr:hypothetical protein KIS4809_0102 [Bacillus sp. ZZV12-4809]
MLRLESFNEVNLIALGGASVHFDYSTKKRAVNSIPLLFRLFLEGV